VGIKGLLSGGEYLGQHPAGAVVDGVSGCLRALAGGPEEIESGLVSASQLACGQAAE
jgi:hypothetical protein